MKVITSIKREFKALVKPLTRDGNNNDRAQENETELQKVDHQASTAFFKPTSKDLTNLDKEPSADIQSQDGAAVEARVISEEPQGPNQIDEGFDQGTALSSAVHEVPDEAEYTSQSPLPDTFGKELASEPPQEEQDNIMISPEEAQAIRQGLYIRFFGEEAEDYTQGPPRFVHATDGVQECGAILMTLDLSQRIQGTLRMQRAFEAAEKSSLPQRRAYMQFETKVEIEIATCRRRLASIKKSDNPKEEDFEAVQQQLEILELLLDDVRLRRENTKLNIKARSEDLRKVQSATLAHLEEVFVFAQLIEPQPEKHAEAVEQLDLQTEYDAFVEKLKNVDNIGDFAAPPLDTSQDYKEKVPPLSEEEQARQELVNSLWASKDAMDLARRDFEDREIQRAREFRANQDAANTGGVPKDESPEAFDVRWVKRNQELTRNLIDAEAAYGVSKRAALEAGIPLPFADGGSYYDATGDGIGYESAVERELAASVPSPVVRSWLSKVPEGVEADSPSDDRRGESDEWEAREVGISDSVSLVAEGRERTRIDRWREACLGEHEA